MTSVSFTTEKRDESVLYHKYREHVKIIEDKIGVNGKYLLIGLTSIGIIIFLGIFDSFFTNLVGTVLPAYLSLKSIESIETDVDKQWITYWVLFSFYGILDKISVLFIYYIPFYYFIKYLVLLWLFMPNSNGAAYLYEIAIFNNFKKLEAMIEKQRSKKNIISDSLNENSQNDISKITEKLTNSQILSNTAVKSMIEISEKKSQNPSKSASELLNEKKNS
jgi:receptor expression-enhancing protein 5/6